MTQDQEHATVGDALIYIARSVGGGLALLAKLGAVVGVVWILGYFAADARKSYDAKSSRHKDSVIAELQSARDTYRADAQTLARGLRIAKEMITAEQWRALVERVESMPRSMTDDELILDFQGLPPGSVIEGWQPPDPPIRALEGGASTGAD